MYFNSFKTVDIGYSRATKNRRRVTINYVSEQKLKYFYKLLKPYSLMMQTFIENTILLHIYVIYL